MTVATIFAGLIPIMYGDGTGSEIMHGSQPPWSVAWQPPPF